MTSKLKVLLADDEALFQELLEDLLSSQRDIRVVGKAADGHEAVRMAKTLKPAVVLMDLEMPKLDGIGATEAIRKECPGVKVVMLSGYRDQACRMRSERAGACAYLTKSLSGTELIEVLRDIVARSFAMDGARERPSRTPRPPGNLSWTQLRVLDLLSQGRNDQDIAEEIGRGCMTVKSHVRAIFRKLRVRSRTQAALEGWRASLIEQPSQSPRCASPTKPPHATRLENDHPCSRLRNH